MLIANYIKNIVKEKKINLCSTRQKSLVGIQSNVRLWAKRNKCSKKIEALEDIAAFVDPKETEAELGINAVSICE